jgi:ABC-type iron transport system FetAB ATPase subunit
LATTEGKQAVDDPSRAFSSPREVVESQLPREEKIKILKSWELDARRLLESAEENMTGGEKDRLPEIQRALRQLEGDA